MDTAHLTPEQQQRVALALQTASPAERVKIENAVEASKPLMPPGSSNISYVDHPAGPIARRDPAEVARRKRLDHERENLPPWREGPVALASRAMDALQYDLPLPNLYRLPDGKEIATRDFLALPDERVAPASSFLPWGVGSPVRQAGDPEVSWGQLNAEILRRCIERGLL